MDRHRPDDTASQSEAKALTRHAGTDLAAHHSSDLFHRQYAVSKATALALARAVRHAEARVVDAQAQWDAERVAQQLFKARVPRSLGRPPAFKAHIAAALSALVARDAKLAQAQARQSEARELIASSAPRVAARFTAVWLRLKELAEAADLPNRARERLVKADGHVHRNPPTSCRSRPDSGGRDYERGHKVLL